MTSWRAVSRSSKALRRAEHGAAAVEFAVLLPVLLLLVIGVVDFGRVFVTGVAVSGAVKAGAQFGAQSATNSVNYTGMTTAAQNDWPDGLGTLTVDAPVRECRCNPSDTPVVGAACGTTAWACTGPGAPAPRVWVRVTARSTPPMLFRYPGIPASITIERRALIRVQ